MMKAGEYYIGDLCYVMNDQEWDEVCDNGLCDGEFTLKDGRKFALYSTAYGDGVYPTSIGGSCCVDAGSIGCILKSDIKTNKYDHINDLAVFHTFDTDFNTSSKVEKEYDEEYEMEYSTKVLRFGNVEVYT